jgi:hypothetical protein
VIEQVRQGVAQIAIARRCGVAIRTIRCWIRARGFPERKSPSHGTELEWRGSKKVQQMRKWKMCCKATGCQKPPYLGGLCEQHYREDEAVNDHLKT